MLPLCVSICWLLLLHAATGILRCWFAVVFLFLWLFAAGSFLATHIKCCVFFFFCFLILTIGVTIDTYATHIHTHLLVWVHMCFCNHPYICLLWTLDVLHRFLCATLSFLCLQTSQVQTVSKMLRHVHRWSLLIHWQIYKQGISAYMHATTNI